MKKRLLCFWLAALLLLPAAAFASEELPSPAEEPAVQEEAYQDNTEEVPAEPTETDPEASYTEPGQALPPFDPTESYEEIAATLPGSLPDTWHESIVSVARSQLGYTTYASDTVIYNRYEHWLGASGARDVQFLRFCLYYAGIPAAPLGQEDHDCAELWAKTLADSLKPADFAPIPGDLVFLDWKEDNNPVKLDDYGYPVLDESGEEVHIRTADTVGIVTYFGDEIWAIFGGDKVVEIKLDPAWILAYMVLPEKPVPEEETPAEEAEPSEEPTEEPSAEAPLPEETLRLDGAALNEAVYPLAPEGYVYLQIADDLADGQTYVLADSPMYFDEENAVFYALIPSDADRTPIAVDGERAVLSYSADVNGDGVVNIADANAIYQMVQNGGSYYTVEQIGLEARLRVDYRSIADFESVMKLINGVA